MLVARFSDNIQADIERGFSCYQLPALGCSYEENLRDCEEFRYRKEDVVALPEGGFGIRHHAGLSCYELAAEDVESAIREAINDSYMDGSGFAQMTVGAVRLLHSIPSAEIGSIRDLHILEVEDVEQERE